jgi:hypothetical protein
MSGGVVREEKGGSKDLLGRFATATSWEADANSKAPRRAAVYKA